MSVDQAAIAEAALAGPPTKRGEMRLLGPIAVALALLSAFVTFAKSLLLNPAFKPEVNRPLADRPRLHAQPRCGHRDRRPLLDAHPGLGDGPAPARPP